MVHTCMYMKLCFQRFTLMYGYNYKYVRTLSCQLCSLQTNPLLRSFFSEHSPTCSTSSSSSPCKRKLYCLVQTAHAAHLASKEAVLLRELVLRGWWTTCFSLSHLLEASRRDSSEIFSVAICFQSFLVWPPLFFLKRGRGSGSAGTTCSAGAAAGRSTWSGRSKGAFSTTSATRDCALR